MTDAQTPEHRYDPLWDAPRSSKNKGPMIIAAIVIILLHASLILYLYRSKILPHYITYEETAVKVNLVKPAPPPPPHR
jgi:protein TonB